MWCPVVGTVTRLRVVAVLGSFGDGSEELRGSGYNRKVMTDSEGVARRRGFKGRRMKKYIRSVFVLICYGLIAASFEFSNFQNIAGATTTVTIIMLLYREM